MVERVNYTRKTPVTETAPQPLATPIRLSEVLSSDLRLEASAYGIDARVAVAALNASGIPLVPLYGKDGLCTEAPKPYRLTRVYVEPAYGVPFLSSSDIISMRPEIQHYISRK